MHKVKRNICIEDYKARLGTRVPTCENGTVIYEDFPSYNDWNRIPYDIIIENETAYSDLIDIAQKLPLCTVRTKQDVTEYVFINNNGAVEKQVDSIDEIRFVLKYKTLSDRYSFLKKLMREARYYRPCLIRGEYKWVELSDSVWENEFGVTVDNPDGTENSTINSDRFFAKKTNDNIAYTWLMYNELPSISEDETEYCCVWSNMNEFLSHFRLDGNDKRYEETFYKLVNDLYTEKVKDMKFMQQYISLQLSLTEDVGLFSNYTPYIQEWIPKKRFYVGDHVHYVMDGSLDPLGNTYKLKDSKDLPKEWINVPTDVYSAFQSSRKNNNSQLSVKYYKGYFDDKSKLTYFDELDANGKIWTDASGNTKHWELCTLSDPTPEISVISAVTESYLTFLQRKKRSFDDYGNELPFIIDNLNSNNGELNYLLGIQGVEVHDDYGVCDVLQTINFYNPSSSAVTYAYNYVDGETAKPIKALDDNRPSTCEYIGFEYYDDCKFSNYSADTTTGVLHKEIYNFTIKTKCAKVTGSNGYFVWVTTEEQEDETVEKLPAMLTYNYDKVFKFQYTGLPEYREMGVVVDITNGSYPTFANPDVGDMVICKSSETSLYVYSDISSESTIEYGWIPKECVAGDAYHFYDKSENEYGDMYMFDSVEWIDMTTDYGITKNNMAYNSKTDSYELFKNGTCYTLQTKFAYIDIDYSTTYHWDNEHEYYSKDSSVLSTIYYNGDNVAHDEFQNAPVFYNEGNGYSVNIKGDDSCDIERGTYAAYERHSILGEINTYQDLLEYKNNLFAL